MWYYSQVVKLSDNKINVCDNNQSHFAFKEVNNYATVKYGNLLLRIIIESVEKKKHFW